MSEILRAALGPKLAAHFEVSLAPMPLVLVELLARFCVVRPWPSSSGNRAEQTSFGAAVGDL
jgi:hypothetical protein